jgi:SAM-dependent methyltransferase
MKNLYDESYFENGVASGVSCYVNYRWLPEQTFSMCQSMINFASIEKSDRILDYGCAKGFTVRALVEMGYDCHGVDISDYAVSQSDAGIRHRLTVLNEDNHNRWFEDKRFDVILCKDVLEHVPYENIGQVLKNFRNISQKLFVIVPLAHNGSYDAPEYELDVTHIIREDLDWWTRQLISAGYDNVTATYRIPGIKDNWSHYQKGNGFFLCT